LNLYCTKVGESVKPIRTLLYWTQAELAKQTGLSRATIINIESEPWRMTRTSALAIFSVVVAETARRNRLLNEATSKPSVDWHELLQDLRLTNLKAWRRILGSSEFVSTGLIPLLGGISFVATNAQTTLPVETHQRLSTAANEALRALSVKLCNIYEIEELALDRFVGKLED